MKKFLFLLFIVVSVSGYQYSGYQSDNNASRIRVNTSGFGVNLTSAENTVQKALDKIDDMIEGSGVSVSDEVYDSDWNGSQDVPTKNVIYDKFESLELTESNTLIDGGSANEIYLVSQSIDGGDANGS